MQMLVKKKTCNKHRHENQKLNQQPRKNCSYERMFMLCTTEVHNAAQNSSDNLPSGQCFKAKVSWLHNQLANAAL